MSPQRRENNLEGRVNWFTIAEKLEAAPGERLERVRNFARTTIIVPEMVGSIIGVHNGKTFNRVKIKPECVGHCLGEFSLTRQRKPHATHASKSSKSRK